jgi:flagellar motility protein MotE (MotC chaperone)
LTEEAADKYAEDVWLFEAEREELRQKHIKLLSWETELDAQTAELRDLQNTLEARWTEMQQQASQDIVHLAKMYGSMRAEQAAEIFNQAGLILANMENRKAYVVSVSMASDNADIRTD